MSYTDGWVYSDYWGGLMADAGPYVGPWPAAPPIPANFPADAGEVDYLIAALNPDGHVEHTADGSYTTDDLDAFRYNSTDGAGANFNGSDPTRPPPGAHLVVIWYSNTGGSTPPQPSTAPLALVPPSYVVGGTGAPVGDPTGGHWSDWFPVQHLSETGYPSQFIGPRGKIRHDYQLWYDSFVSETATVPGLQATVVAGTPDTGYYTNVVDTGMSVTVRKDWYEPPGVDVEPHGLVEKDTEMDVSGAQYVVGIGFVPTLPIKGPDMSGLVEGVDYVAIPGQQPNAETEYVQYETPDPIFLGWDSIVANWDLLTTMEGNTWSPAPFTFRWGVCSIADIGTDSWPAYGIGTELASYTADANDFTPRTPVPISQPLDLSGITDSLFALVLQIDYFGSNPLPPPAADLSPPGEWPVSPVSAQRSDFGVTGLFSPGGVPAVVGHYDVPRYRYWIPGPASAPTVKVLTPVRLFQRNDGHGPSAHPRILNSSMPNGASSAQASSAPRVGSANVYDSGGSL